MPLLRLIQSTEGANSYHVRVELERNGMRRNAEARFELQRSHRLPRPIPHPLTPVHSRNAHSQNRRVPRPRA
jgi:hypothetical protein